MSEHYELIAKNYLSLHGYSGVKLKDILGGFDFEKPAYNQTLDTGNILYQFVRRTSHNNAIPKIGNWFCLPGAELTRLAIFSGGEGRLVAKIRVVMPVVGLEGVASPQNINWVWSGGGIGGATQIFMPDKFLMSYFRVLGYSTDVKGLANI